MLVQCNIEIYNRAEVEQGLPEKKAWHPFIVNLKKVVAAHPRIENMEPVFENTIIFMDGSADSYITDIHYSTFIDYMNQAHPVIDFKYLSRVQ